MTSLTSSLGHPVALVFHDAISFSGPSFASSWHQPSRRKLSCNCTLPTSSSSATPSILPSTHDSLHSAPETEITKAVNLLQRDPPRTSIFHGHQRSAAQSVMSLIVALAMTIGIQGAPSSRDTFEDVPQTLSGADKGQRIQKPKSAKAESCTRKCVSTCIRGEPDQAKVLSMFGDLLWCSKKVSEVDSTASWSAVKSAT